MTMKKIFTMQLTGLFVLILLANGFGQTLIKKGDYWIGTIEKSFKVKPGGKLIMEKVKGDIDVQTWDQNSVNIHEIKKMDIFTESEAKAAMDASDTGYSLKDNTIYIGGPAFDRNWITSDFEIKVPEEFNCELSTKGGDITVSKVKGSVEASSGGGDIEVRSVQGPVDLKTGGGDIEIVNTTSTVEAKSGGGEVSVSGSTGSVNVMTGGGDVSVSRTDDEVKVTTGGGDVEISYTKGNTSVTTGGGDIDINDAGGNVKATTGGGDIDISHVSGHFKASTGGGDVDANDISGSISISTGGGDIDAEGIKGAADLSTGGGDVVSQITLTDFSVDHHINISTGGGDIDLTIPAKLPATVDATIKFKEKGWEKYDITSDFPLTISKKSDDSHYQIIQAKGDINGGGDQIMLKTGGGDIHIRKLKSK